MKLSLHLLGDLSCITRSLLSTNVHDIHQSNRNQINLREPSREIQTFFLNANLENTAVPRDSQSGNKQNKYTCNVPVQETLAQLPPLESEFETRERMGKSRSILYLALFLQDLLRIRGQNFHISD